MIEVGQSHLFSGVGIFERPMGGEASVASNKLRCYVQLNSKALATELIRSNKLRSASLPFPWVYQK